MKGKNTFSSVSKKRKGIKPYKNQFGHFWEVVCPDCGKTIDLEILINLMKGRLKNE